MTTSDIAVTWQSEKAFARFQMISPLLDPGLDSAKRIQMRKSIAEANNVSVKSLRRYEHAYASLGFTGLQPANRTSHLPQTLPDNFPELLREAIQLKREVPTRSVSQLIYILEGEGLVPPGCLKRSTLQKHLYDAGFGQKQMRKYTEGRKSSSKRFCKPHRMMLVQADIKYGPKLPIGKNGTRVQTYLSSIIDDHSRYILASQFYDNQEQTIVEDTFRRAILAHGTFDAAYCDNGKQYISQQLLRSTAMLGIRVLHARPYSGQSKGKIEKFHQVVDDFIAEAKVKKIQSLEELNRYWSYFLNDYYQIHPHDGIREYYEAQGVQVPDEGISPETEWNRDSRKLVYLDAARVGEAFLHHEERVVDKGGCITFRGRLYEASASLIGAKVTISYDPMAADSVTVHYKGMDSIRAVPVRMGAFCDRKPELPAAMQEAKPETSRFLDLLEKQHRERQEKMTNAISFGSYRKEGE